MTDMYKCAAKDCEIRQSANISFFSLPKEKTRFKAWVRNCQLEDTFGSRVHTEEFIEKCRICSLHFESCMFTEKNKLHAFAVPTVFLSPRARKIKSSMTKVPSPTVIGDTSNADEVISICTDATFQDADVGTSLLSEIKEEILECEESSLTPEITMREGIETVYLSSNSEIKNFLPEDDHQPEPFQHRESISKTQQKANISVKPMSKLKVRKTSDLLSPSVLKSQEKKNIEILKSKTINTRGRLRLHDNKPLLIMDANHLKDFDYKINCVEKTPVFVLHSNVVIPVSVFQDTNFINAVKSGLIKVVTFNVLCEFLLSI